VKCELHEEPEQTAHHENTIRVGQPDGVTPGDSDLVVNVVPRCPKIEREQPTPSTEMVVASMTCLVNALNTLNEPMI
jgi:hypothetical protein